MPEWSDHARDRMEERDITDEDVAQALKRRSGQPRPGNNGNIVVLGYGRRGRILRVVLTPDQQVIVSVMWLDD
ncbi:MAG TPA: DUF4258 domain-containing protein [Streptosporangiaceae bacterium]|jgi:Domain of unknown function (DUF4258)